MVLFQVQQKLQSGTEYNLACYPCSGRKHSPMLRMVSDHGFKSSDLNWKKNWPYVSFLLSCAKKWPDLKMAKSSDPDWTLMCQWHEVLTPLHSSKTQSETVPV